MIYVGYQGVGKSSIAGKNNNIDLESANFWVDGKRQEDWYKIYANIAKHLSDQGYNVFVSSHKALRVYMESQGIEFTTICPARELKDTWIERLRKRYELDGEEKHFKALENARQCYDDNITDLMSEKNVIVIDSVDYDLNDIVSGH